MEGFKASAMQPKALNNTNVIDEHTQLHRDQDCYFAVNIQLTKHVFISTRSNITDYMQHTRTQTNARTRTQK